MVEGGLTDEGEDDEEDVEAEPGVGGGEEVRDGADLDDDGGDDGGEEQLEGEDDVDLADERPAQLRALLHPRVELPRAPRAGGGAARGPRLDVDALLVPEHPGASSSADDDGGGEELLLSLSPGGWACGASLASRVGAEAWRGKWTAKTRSGGASFW